MTRSKFLATYRQELLYMFPKWTGEPAAVASFMLGVAETLDGGNRWIADGIALKAAWRLIGGKGRPTLKKLRALPVEG